jgi:predicted TIM-barrel fold metal-dependent hydrolase
MYVITMEGSRQSLSEWIDLVPGNRILGFGSDVHFPEFIYGHLLMARSCIADILSEKVKRDFISEEVAMDLVNKMLRENAVELYSLR